MDRDSEREALMDQLLDALRGSQSVSVQEAQASAGHTELELQLERRVEELTKTVQELTEEVQRHLPANTPEE